MDYERIHNQLSDRTLQSHLWVESLHTGASVRVPFAKVRWHFADPNHLSATFLRTDPRQVAATILPLHPTAQDESLLVQVERDAGASRVVPTEAFQLRLVYRSATCLTVAVYAPAHESGEGEIVGVLDCFWWDQFWLQAALVVLDAGRLCQAQAVSLLCWTLENLSVSTREFDVDPWDDLGPINDYRCDILLGN